MRDVLTVEQAAAVLQVTPRTVYQWLKERRIPGRKVGKVWLVPHAALLEYLRGEPAFKATIGERDGTHDPVQDLPAVPDACPG